MQRLAVHARGFGSRIPAHAFQRAGDGQRASPNARIGLCFASLRSTAGVRSRRIESARILPSIEATMQGNHTHEAQGSHAGNTSQAFGRRYHKRKRDLLTFPPSAIIQATARAARQQANHTRAQAMK